MTSGFPIERKIADKWVVGTERNPKRSEVQCVRGGQCRYSTPNYLLYTVLVISLMAAVLTEAATEVSSNCEVLVGPRGSWNTAPAGTQGGNEHRGDPEAEAPEVEGRGARRALGPHVARRLSFSRFLLFLISLFLLVSGCGASSAGTCSCGGITWS